MGTVTPMDRPIQIMLSQVLDSAHKALPAASGPIALGDIGREGWNALEGDLSFPVMLLKESALANNVELMAAFCRQNGFDLAPHGKTTMAPQLIQRQMRAGAWGVTAATATQAALFHRFGVPRIILANQLLDPAGVRWVVRSMSDDPPLELYCLVDSVAVVEQLDRLLVSAAAPDPLPVLLELGVQGRRAGARSRDDALAVVGAVSRAQRLVLAGVEAFEGVIGADRTAETVGAVRDFLLFSRSLTDDLITAGAFAGRPEAIMSVGGSAYPDLVAEVFGLDWIPSQPTRRILRSGGYLTHDHGLYAAVSPFSRSAGHELGSLIPALEIWGLVLSRPEPDLAIVGFGKRDVPYDIGLPVPIAVRRSDGSLVEPDPRLVVTDVNDQHAMVHVPDSGSVEIGQVIGFGISHPCTAFDKWGLVPVVDDGYRVVDAVRTFF